MIMGIETTYRDVGIYYESYVAKDQEWDKRTLQQLKDDYNIYYDGGIRPIKIIDNKFVVMGYEDDGTIWFEKDEYGGYRHAFDPYWIDSIIKGLQDVKKEFSNNGN